MSLGERLAANAAAVEAEMAGFDEQALLDRVHRTLGIDGPLTVHVQVVLQMGHETFVVAEGDVTEDGYRTQVVDLLHAAARAMEDG